MIEVYIQDQPEFQEFSIDESYKRIRTNIEFSGMENNVIAFTSCTSGEGKSTTSFNIASSLAEGGKKVLFIDSDMRNSTFSSRVRTNQKKIKGLSHLLSGQVGLEECLTRTNRNNLYAIFSGPKPPNPSELLNSDKFKNYIEQFRKEFDYVIIDAAPLGLVIDGAIVAAAAGSAIVVIEAGVTSLKFVRNVLDQLDKSGTKILGTVLNKVQKEHISGYGYGYGYGYGGESPLNKEGK